VRERQKVCVYVFLNLCAGGGQRGVSHVSVDIFVRIFLLYRFVSVYYIPYICIGLQISNQCIHSPIFASSDPNTLAYIRALYDTLCTHRLYCFYMAPCIYTENQESLTLESLIRALYDTQQIHTLILFLHGTLYTHRKSRSSRVRDL